MAKVELTPAKLAELKAAAQSICPAHRRWNLNEYAFWVDVYDNYEVIVCQPVHINSAMSFIAEADPATVLAMVEEIERLQEIVDNLLDHCPHIECSKCSEIVCPHNSRLHLHHDGCPECFHRLEESEAGHGK